jgi:2,4-dienoyl-CoA reductase (NADPH2)
MLLTEPITLAGRTAPSRVLFGPHVTNLGRGRGFSERHAAYYRTRAAGGCGLLVTETASVHRSDHPYERAPLAADCAPGWAEVARACRPHGALVLAGLGHGGAQGSSAHHQAALWAPSRVADVVSRELPMELEQPQLEELLAGFATAAALAAEAGLDGVEVDAGQHSLLRQFLSGLTNLREDAYGQDRGLLPQQVLERVRDALGDGPVLGLRLCCDELAPWAGITPEQAAGLAQRFAPLVDYLVVVRGSGMSVSATRPDLHTAPGFNTELTRGVRAAVAGAVPVVLQGSVVDHDAAQRALDEGVADAVEMTRAQIAEPRLVSLVRGGRAGRIRPCLLCYQRCQVRDSRNPLVSCVAEPGAGHETTEPAPEGTDPGALDVLVVGGGPCGLEAARVLAARGHRTELRERDDEPGGALRWAAQVHGRERLARLTGWLTAEALDSGVRITTGSPVGAAELESALSAGRLVLLATGSRPGPRGYRADGVPVLDAAELLAACARSGPAPAMAALLPPGPVLLVDPVGDAVAVGTAELLAAHGREPYLVSPDRVAGTQLSRTGDLADANARLQRAGVAVSRLSVLRGVSPAGAVVEHVLTGVRTTVPCASVVHCGHRLPEEELFLAAAGHRRVVRAGDAVAPRTAYEAVLEGRRAALALVREAALLVGEPR